MYLTDPEQIENKSMAIIEQGLDTPWDEPARTLVKRAIHATGDFEYQRLLHITPGAVAAGIEAIQGGCRIVTDTMMAFSGLNKRALEKAHCHVDCYIADETVVANAKAQGLTRAMAAVDFAMQATVDIFVIGNAPTALFRLGEMIEDARLTPELIIGVPVGFVGAAESKAYLRRLRVPSISTAGTKGGSNVAAALLNAIIYLAVGKA